MKKKERRNLETEKETFRENKERGGEFNLR